MKCGLGNLLSIQEAISRCDEKLIAYEVGKFYSRRNNDVHERICRAIREMRELPIECNSEGLAIQVDTAGIAEKRAIIENPWQDTLPLRLWSDGLCNGEKFNRVETHKQVASICHLMLLSGATQAEARKCAYLHSNREGRVFDLV